MGNCQEHISQEKIDVTNILEIVATTLSLFGSFSTILLLVLKNRKQKISLDRHNLELLIVYLAISDFFGSAVGVSTYIQSKYISNKKANEILCYTFRALWQFFYTATFFWTSCVAFYTQAKFSKAPYQTVAPSKSRFFIIYHAISWGIPLIIIVVAVAGNFIHHPPNQFWCSLDKNFAFVSWFGPMILTFVWNTVLYGLLVSQLRKRSKFRLQSGQYKKMEIRLMKKISMFLLVFLLCCFT
eukprot:TRINITY_DN1263_c0_g1_i1.p1 TRINITY_DN1263_c0_g1~~TRINITY_DN1263_c0_g1_i1.p1  ORF type:complete len:266 (-),score=28.76 TRINITY_DN1263_c0_g1_i1:235-957(-)